MKYISRGVRLMQLAIFLFIAAHTHGVMAYEVILVNMTPNTYKVEFTWAQKAGVEYSESFSCDKNTTCNKVSDSDEDPQEHDYVAPKLTGEFRILQKTQ